MPNAAIRRRCLVLATLLAPVLALAQGVDARLATREPGVAPEGDRLLVTLPIVNLGRTEASGVVVTGIRLGGHEILSPRLPLEVGDIPAGEELELALAFRGGGGIPRAAARLEIAGTLRQHGRTRSFELRRRIPPPQPEHGRGTARTVRLKARRVTGGGLPPNHDGVRVEGMNQEQAFPQVEGTPRGIEEPETPAVELEPYAPPPPVEGRRSGSFAPDNPAIGIRAFDLPAVGTLEDGMSAINDPVVFVRGGVTLIDSPPSSPPAALEPGPVEPSGASVDVHGPSGFPQRVVFQTGNLYALFSTDGGASFTRLDPTTIFPLGPTDEGWCCDQNVIYVPSIDRFVWTLLSRGRLAHVEVDLTGKQTRFNGFNTLRVASASPQELISSGGTSWSYFDLTPQSLGLANTGFLDYPDVSFTENYLHVSVDNAYRCKSEGGLIVARVPLAQVAQGGQIVVNFSDPADGRVACLARLAHDVPDAAYWFGHATNSGLRVFEWPDGSPDYSWSTIPIASWTRITKKKKELYQSFTPIGANWLKANTDAVRGATFQGITSSPSAEERRLVVAWNAGRGGAFPQPYVRVVHLRKLTTSLLTLWTAESSQQLWHSDFAFHHAHLATNANGEVGVSVAAGGGGKHEVSAAAGFLGDDTLFVGAESTTSLNRWGDYTAIRRHWPDPKLFFVSDYVLLRRPGRENLPEAVMRMHQNRLFGREIDAAEY
jgi:hypothetical protein